MDWGFAIVFLLVIINVAALITVAVDKHKARHRKWRIPERNLFLLGLIGGCPGVYIGFLVFRHKTKHLKFMLGIPVIFVLQILAVYFINEKIGLNLTK